MNRTTLLLGLLPAAVIVAAVAAWFAPGSRGRDVPDEPFAPSQAPGAAVATGEYRLSGPYAHGNLEVFLVHGPETLSGTSFLTLQEGLEQKRAVVHETGSVGELEVENRAAAEDLFVQSGDIVKGGKQDRTLPYDTIVGPASGRVPVSSFCVEQGRWSKRGKEESSYFSSSSDNLSTNALKRAAAAPGEASQAAVWSNVAKTQERLEQKLGGPVKGAESGTSLQLTMESPAVKAAMAPYLTALSAVPAGHADAIGCVVAVNGRVVSADVYAARGLFTKLWPKLLSAGAVEAFLAAGPKDALAPMTANEVRAFFAEADGGTVASEAVTERTYVSVRQSTGVVLLESCDRARNNLVLHRTFLAR